MRLAAIACGLLMVMGAAVFGAILGPTIAPSDRQFRTRRSECCG